jgi:HD superfamily phosphodiesterase
LGSLPPEIIAQRGDLLKDRVAAAMRRYFGPDARRIKHAEEVAAYAAEIGRQEQGNLAVIMAAAYLHDIGIREAERKYNSSAAHHQHAEGPPVARELLSELKAETGLIDEVCDIIGHHHSPRPEETTNLKVLYDADLIVNLEEQYREKPPAGERLETILNKSFLTGSGRRVAKKALIKYVQP